MGYFFFFFFFAPPQANPEKSLHYANDQHRLQQNYDDLSNQV